MDIVTSFGIVLLFSLLGEILKYIIPLPIPANIYGMILLFFALNFKLVKLEKINTVCLFANPNLMNISSSAVREIFSLDKDVSRYVCPIVKEKMLTKKVGR